MLTLQMRQEKWKTRDIQNGGGNGETIGCIKGVLLEMCHWLNLSEDIHTANIGYSAGRGIMGWGSAYLNNVLLRECLCNSGPDDFAWDTDLAHFL